MRSSSSKTTTQQPTLSTSLIGQLFEAGGLRSNNQCLVEVVGNEQLDRNLMMSAGIVTNAATGATSARKSAAKEEGVVPEADLQETDVMAEGAEADRSMEGQKS